MSALTMKATLPKFGVPSKATSTCSGDKGSMSEMQELASTLSGLTHMMQQVMREPPRDPAGGSDDAFQELIREFEQGDEPQEHFARGRDDFAKGRHARKEERADRKEAFDDLMHGDLGGFMQKMGEAETAGQEAKKDFSDARQEMRQGLRALEQEFEPMDHFAEAGHDFAKGRHARKEEQNDRNEALNDLMHGDLGGFMQKMEDAGRAGQEADDDFRAGRQEMGKGRQALQREFEPLNDFVEASHDFAKGRHEQGRQRSDLAEVSEDLGHGDLSGALRKVGDAIVAGQEAKKDFRAGRQEMNEGFQALQQGH